MSSAGSVAGISFMPPSARSTSADVLAVGAYGSVNWINSASEPLVRGATAVLSVAVSDDASQVAVGCLDKVMRLFDLSGTSTTASDWVGFDAGVSLVAFSSGSSWLAAAGGTNLLVVPRNLPIGEPPVLCRTPGTSAPDGAGGACGRFTALEWFRSHPLSALAALEGRAGRLHVFDVASTDDAFPRRASRLYTVQLPGEGMASALTYATSRTTTAAAEEATQSQEQTQTAASVIAVSRGNELSGIQFII